MADNFQNSAVTSSNPSPINEFDNIVISDTLVYQQVEIIDSWFTSVVRDILERDHTYSPYTPYQIEQSLRESRIVLTRIYSQ